MRTPLLLSVMLLAGARLASADPIVAAVARIPPHTGDAFSFSVGDTITVDIGVSYVPDLYDYQFSLAFDPHALRADSITEAPFFANTGRSFFTPGTIDNTSGVLSLTADTLFGPGPGLVGPGLLATAQFTALAAGSTSITLAPLSDLVLEDSQGNTLGYVAQSSDILVGNTAVPEPSTVSLLLVGLAFLGIAARRLNTSAAMRLP